MTDSSAIGIGFLRRPELAVLALSPLSLALLSLTRDDRLSRLLTPTAPLSESIERFGTCTPFTAFLRCRGDVGDACEEDEDEDEDECACDASAAAALLFAFLDGESVKRGSHECECDSASEPSVEVDQRERSVRSGSALIDSVDGERRIGLSGMTCGLAFAEAYGAGVQWESLLLVLRKVTSMSKSNEESGEAGAESLICEYTEMLCGVVGHGSLRFGSASSTGLSSGRSAMSAGTDERGGGRSPLVADTGVETMKWLLGEGGTEPAADQASCAGTVSSVPRKPAPRAAFASSASRSSVACSIAESPGERGVGTGTGGGGGGRVGTR